MALIFLSWHERAHDNKEFSQENPKPFYESWITTHYVEPWKAILNLTTNRIRKWVIVILHLITSIAKIFDGDNKKVRLKYHHGPPTNKFLWALSCQASGIKEMTLFQSSYQTILIFSESYRETTLHTFPEFISCSADIFREFLSKLNSTKKLYFFQSSYDTTLTFQRVTTKHYQNLKQEIPK